MDNLTLNSSHSSYNTTEEVAFNHYTLYILGLPGHTLFLCSLLGKHTHTLGDTHSLFHSLSLHPTGTFTKDEYIPWHVKLLDQLTSASLCCYVVYVWTATSPCFTHCSFRKSRSPSFICLCFSTYSLASFILPLVEVCECLTQVDGHHEPPPRCHGDHLKLQHTGP